MSRGRQSLSVEQLELRDVPSRYIVTLQPGVSAEDFAGEQRGQGRAVAQVYSHAFNGVVIEGSPPAFDPRIVAVEPDRVVSIQGKPTSPPPPPPGEIVPTGVARIGGPGGGSTDLGQVNVAVLDTGIDATHPDLNVVGAINFCSRSSTPADENGHGTHVSGTIGAKDNDIGVVGVAPGVSLYGVKVLDRNGNGRISDILLGIDWVTATRGDGIDGNDIAVANMSLGAFGYSTAMRTAIQGSVAVGVVYAVSAGNSDADAGNYSPAGFPEVITVSALADSDGKTGGLGKSTGYGADDTLATFSNWGAAVDIAGPGVNILSTIPGGRYGTMSGTSMASPHVTGAAALYVARYGMPDDYAGVTAVRDALVGAGQPMAGWRADTADTNSDGDPAHEPLLVNQDAGITSIALDPAANGPGIYSVKVTVVNTSPMAQGLRTVSLYDGESWVGDIDIPSLGVGGSTTVTFTWTATGGEHTLKATLSTTALDYNLLDDTLSLDVTI